VSEGAKKRGTRSAGKGSYGKDRNLEIPSHMSCGIGEGRKTGEPLMVTHFAHPVAQISAPGVGLKAVRKLGTHVGMGEILGDIVGPIGDESDWEAAQDESDEVGRIEGRLAGKSTE